MGQTSQYTLGARQAIIEAGESSDLNALWCRGMKNLIQAEEDDFGPDAKLYWKGYKDQIAWFQRQDPHPNVK